LIKQKKILCFLNWKIAFFTNFFFIVVVFFSFYEPYIPSICKCVLDCKKNYLKNLHIYFIFHSYLPFLIFFLFIRSLSLSLFLFNFMAQSFYSFLLSYIFELVWENKNWKEIKSFIFFLFIVCSKMRDDFFIEQKIGILIL